MSTKFEKVKKFALARKKFRFGDLNRHFGRPVSEQNTYTTYLNMLRHANLVKNDKKGNYVMPNKKELRRIVLGDLILRNNYELSKKAIERLERERNDLLHECRTAHNDAESSNQALDVAEELLKRERKSAQEFEKRYIDECEAVSRNLSFVRETKDKKIAEIQERLNKANIGFILSIITILTMFTGWHFSKKAVQAECMLKTSEPAKIKFKLVDP